MLTCVSKLQAMLALGRQLLLHPLRKYPGPFLAKFTDGFMGYHALRKRLHLATYASLTKYGRATGRRECQLHSRPLTQCCSGPVIRVAPNRLVFNTVEAFHGILLGGGQLLRMLANAAQISTSTQIYRDQASISTHNSTQSRTYWV